MAERYPEIEPYESGFLDVGDGHSLYWESVGDPAGTPAVWLHGGPGSGSTLGIRRSFDPGAYRLVVFDQRGCGRSRPLADSAAADLTTRPRTSSATSSCCASTSASTAGTSPAVPGA